MDKIEKFIFDMKNVFPEELEFTFYRGYCYWFAFILANRFKGEIWFNPAIVHFATKVGNKLYDVYGEVRPGVNPFTGEYHIKDDVWISWEEFQYNNHDAAESVISSCIKKE